MIDHSFIFIDIKNSVIHLQNLTSAQIFNFNELPRRVDNTLVILVILPQAFYFKNVYTKKSL